MSFRAIRVIGPGMVVCRLIGKSSSRPPTTLAQSSEPTAEKWPSAITPLNSGLVLGPLARPFALQHPLKVLIHKRLDGVEVIDPGQLDDIRDLPG